MKLITIPGKQSFNELKESIVIQAESFKRMKDDIDEKWLSSFIWALEKRLEGMKAIITLLEQYLEQAKTLLLEKNKDNK